MPTKYTQTKRKKFRDTNRKRKKVIREKFGIRGKICTLNNKWNNRKLEEEAETLMKAAEK